MENKQTNTAAAAEGAGGKGKRSMPVGDALMVAGAVAVTIGAGLIALAGGFIIGGAFAILFGALLELRGGDGHAA